jgi:DNA primase
MSVRFDYTIVNQVAQANDIVDVVSEHIALKRKGKEMVGLCPFHDDHRPSLNVNPTKQIFKCFACGAGGNVFTFLQMRENLTFPQALQRLAERAAIQLPTDKQQATGDKRESIDPNKLAKLNEWAAKHFQQNLQNKQKGKSARDYLAKRKITPQSIKKWQLGLAINSPNDLLNAAKSKAIPQKLLQQAGLVVTQANSTNLQDKFINRLMFPITDVTGRVIGFGGRAMHQSQPKYLNSPTTALFDKSNCLYGLQHARQKIVSTQVAVVVEGYTDCIMAHQFGCDNVVASLGTSFTAGQARILRRYAKKVVLIFDSDTAGTEAANRALEVCLSQHIDIKLASLPQAKDPCDFLLSAGKQQFQRLVDEATDVFLFKWNRLIQRFASTETLTDNKAAIEEFLQTIATAIRAGNLPALNRGLIVNRLSKIIGLDPTDINTELRRRIARAARTADGSPATSHQLPEIDWGQGLPAAAQREILEVLLNQPNLFDSIKQKITPDLFDVPILRQIAALLFETITTQPDASLAAVSARAQSPQLTSAIVQLAQQGEEKGNFQARLTGASDVLQRYHNKRKKGQLKPEDQTQFLRSICERTEKENRHNLGMI